MAACNTGLRCQAIFQHGGSEAVIVRVFNGTIASSTSTITLGTGGSDLVLEAAGPGLWGSALRATVDHDTSDPSDTTLFNLLIEELDAPGSSTVIAAEQFHNISTVATHSRFVDTVLNAQAALVNVRTSTDEDAVPTEGVVTAVGSDADDGDDITDAEITGRRDERRGIYALDDADLFNMMCIPPLTRSTDVADGTWAIAANYCQERRAMLIIDSPSAWTASPDTAISDAEIGVNNLRGTVGNATAINAMAYFPRLRMPDPLSENRLADFAPCGAIAGITARTDLQRGVWKAPAGRAASFSSVQGLTYTMTHAQIGVLNPVGLNCLRSLPVIGHLVWGSRTLAGANQLASQWKYVPVRRLALFLEESLLRGTQWVIFEPNEERLWGQIRLSIGAFMQTLFRQGAFQGSTANDAYLVKCDRQTTTQNDIDRGVVNIVVGFAPLKPAEFMFVRLQQMAGQIEV